MFKRIPLLVLLITLIGMLAACATPTVPITPITPTVAPISTSTATVPPAATPTATAVPPEAFQSLSTVKIPAPSLANNLVGEPAEREIVVYLPPAYGTPNKRFPTVYYLPGYGDSGMIGFYLPANLDKLIESGKVKDMIVVVANGVSKMGGSFYVNSPVTGNWEDFIAQDVVDYVDDHFRTLAQPESRGIAGHSMGGFGALNLAMHRPDVFGAVYSMSPGLFDENGLRESQMFDNDDLIAGFVEYENELASLPADEAEQRMFTAPQPLALSYGYAFAPNPDRQPPYYDYPFQEVNGKLVRDDVAWKKWESGYGGIADEAKQYKDNFLKLNGIVVDYGESDQYAWIPKGCVYFGEQLTAAGIPVKVEAYSGTHESALGDRIRDHMFPYFATTLKSD
jgi:S-formylglutathione hydrolase